MTIEEYANRHFLHGLVEEQAKQTPNAVAVIYGKTVISYSELNESANRLAKFLHDTLGVRKGHLVGVIMERSELMIIALLGILKAGAGYAPINPSDPWERVNYMVKNAGIRTLVVNSDTVASASGFQGNLYIFDVEFSALPHGACNLPTNFTDAELAYVIYTSGSTGLPKGVAVEHRAIVNTILWRNQYYGLNEQDVTLQMPSYAFDSSVADIFCSLSSGGRLVIPREDLRMDIEYIKQTIQSHGATRLLLTPSYYALLSRELHGITGIRSITVAGESITSELISSHYKHLPGVRLVNEYGPTENTVCSTACDLHEDSDEVQIGGPITNTQVFVLDSNLKPAPPGIPGEIYLAGAGLARGYINQPSLTAERFIPIPFPEFAGRMYKTGDRARWRNNGSLEFIGRVDSQVKIHGFRIELTEIECALMRHHDVELAVVACKQDQNGDKYLAAYVASRLLVSASELVNSIKNQLPRYMVPKAVHVMANLPLNVNGKTDIATLIKMPDSEQSPTPHEMATTPTQKSLTVLCSAVLQREKIGLDENFFDAFPASSLKVMQLVIRIRAELKVSVELRDIYIYPTIRQLAGKIGKSCSDFHDKINDMLNI